MAETVESKAFVVRLSQETQSSLQLGGSLLRIYRYGIKYRTYRSAKCRKINNI
jgi:hypothetical protein